jgi:hypothetical protein
VIRVVQRLLALAANWQLEAPVKRSLGAYLPANRHQ